MSVPVEMLTLVSKLPNYLFSELFSVLLPCCFSGELFSTLTSVLLMMLRDLGMLKVEATSFWFEKLVPKAIADF